MAYHRKTMGNDWGGRKAMNPSGISKVTKKQVLELAAKKGIEVRKEPGNFSMWFGRKKAGDLWWSLGMTNFLALNAIENLNPITLTIEYRKKSITHTFDYFSQVKDIIDVVDKQLGLKFFETAYVPYEDIILDENTRIDVYFISGQTIKILLCGTRFTSQKNTSRTDAKPAYSL